MELEEMFSKFGQSIWLDYIRRRMLLDGELARLVEQDGIRGVTSNPSIFEKAIGGSSDYDDAILQLIGDPDISSATLYEHVAIEDIQIAADLLAPLYVESNGGDGYVCIEVSPYLAHDAAGTIVEGRRLWREVSRENIMVKVPATKEGLPAIRQLIGEGINVNVTLLFSRSRCRQVFDAYADGLEALARRGDDKIAKVASVASMFVSRIDAAVHPLLESGSMDLGLRSQREKLFGKVAIANAKLAYQDWKEACATERFQSLVRRGAKPQRLLWASTGTKDARLSDVVYVEELVGPNTVTTVPPATLEAFRDHGVALPKLESDLVSAQETLAELARLDISLDEVTDALVVQGVQLFSSAFDALLASIDRKREAVSRRPTIPARSKGGGAMDGHGILKQRAAQRRG